MGRYEVRYRRYRTAIQRWKAKNPAEAHARAHEAEPRELGENGGVCVTCVCGGGGGECACEE